MTKAPTKRPLFEDDGIVTPKPSKQIKRCSDSWLKIMKDRAKAESSNVNQWRTLIEENSLTYREVEALYLHPDGSEFRDDVPTNIGGDPVWRVALREGNIGFFIQDLKRICREVYNANREADTLHYYLPSVAMLRGFNLVTKKGQSLKRLFPDLPFVVKQELRAVLGNNRLDEIDWSLYEEK
jgi:hypothetical protein